MADFTKTLQQASSAYKVARNLHGSDSNRVGPIQPDSEFPSIFYQEKLKTSADEEQEQGRSANSSASRENKDKAEKRRARKSKQLPEMFQLILDDNSSKLLSLWGGYEEFKHTLVVKKKRGKRGVTTLQPMVWPANKMEKIPESIPQAYYNSETVFKEYVGSKFIGAI